MTTATTATTTDDGTSDVRAALAALPRLAAQAAPRQAGSSDPADGIHTAPGSKPPPGVDLDAIDVSRGRQHPALLERLSQCVRTVWEEHPARHQLPLMAVGDEVTWASESAWLLDTADWWTTDPWCVEWIERELFNRAKPKGILVRLSAMIEAQVDRFVCQVCGVRLEAHTTDALIVALCDRCDAVAGMRPRLTERQRADAQAKAAGRLLRAILDKGAVRT